MLDGLFLGAAIEAVAEALRAAPAGPIAIVAQPRLARGLAELGKNVIAVDAEARALKKVKGERVVASGDALPFGERTLGALVGFGAGARADWADLLAEWSRALDDGGLLVMLDKPPSTELSRRALCAGLCELRQRPAGRLVVTSGLVTGL